ncbi:unnamed protein product [Ceutorhynchus assimilis]|uniref:Uncharacterized protein n=1 Tax=Ceutorhynchus assimilis TaxID=467358 RepID=A0A9N9N084_9CUCU|nr:unnamed protein product [Ceutorhynchus assimilis]
MVLILTIFNSETDIFPTTNNNYNVPSSSLPESSPESLPQTPNISNTIKSKEFLKSLTSWAVKTHSDFEGIPKDCRTLLKFDKSLKKDITLIDPGQYYHFGLKQGILESLKREKNSENYLVDGNILKVSVNIDGLPLTKSSSSQIWPILACLDNLEYSVPFPIGIYHGKTKPENSNNFLNIFVEEFQAIKTTGVNLNSTNFQVKISKILCFAPAKAYVLNVKGHT